MAKAEITGANYNSHSQDNVLNKTTQMPFYKKGLKNVFFQGLTRTIKTKSNNMYSNYIRNKIRKEVFIEDTIACSEAEYMNYLNWLTIENGKATSLGQVIKNMCPDPQDVFKKFDFYSLALVHKEQYNNKTAHKKISKLFYQDSIDLIKRSLDRLITREVIPPSDSEAVALFFVQNILISSEMHIQRINRQNISIDLAKMYNDYKLFIVSLLKGKT